MTDCFTAYVDNHILLQLVVDDVLRWYNNPDNEILQYNNSTSKFENQNDATNDGHPLVFKNDVSGSGTTSIAVTIADDSAVTSYANVIIYDYV